MPIYPSLEDFKAADLVQNAPEVAAQNIYEEIDPIPDPAPALEETGQSRRGSGILSQAYPPLRDVMRLEFSDALIRANMPEYLDDPVPDSTLISSSTSASTATKSNQSQAIVKPKKGKEPKKSKGKIGLKVRGLASGDWVNLRTSDNLCIKLERAH